MSRVSAAGTRREIPLRTLVLLVVFASLALVTLDSRGNGLIETVRDVARDALAPVRSGVDSAFSPLEDAVNGVSGYGSVKSENERLRLKVDDLRGRLRRERAVGSRVGELERLVDLPTIEDATGVTARVIASAPGNFQRTIELDRGANTGIEVDQPVVTGGGLVGKITDVSATRSTVILIDSPGFGVGVRLEKSNDKGIAEGRTGDRELRLGFLSNARVKIDEGELVFTAATADAVFPPDVPVARVSRVTKPRGDLEPTVTLTPLVDLDNLTFVKVLRSSGPSTG